MPRGGKRAGAGRKPNPHKEKPLGEVPTPRSRTYDPQVAAEARKLTELGATNVDLADFFGVSAWTIGRWAVEFSDFALALRVGKEAADDRVEKSLYNRAVGYTFESEKVFQYRGEIVRAMTREHVPPETTAMIFWLKNRRPDGWRDKSEVNHKFDVSLMSDDELSRIASGSSDGTPPAPRGPSKPH